MKRDQNDNMNNMGLGRRIARLDRWIVALALLWAGTGLTLLLGIHTSHLA